MSKSMMAASTTAQDAASDATMAAVFSKLGDYIKTEDDLLKLSGVKKTFLKEYETINNSLALENDKNMGNVLNGLNSLSVSQHHFEKLQGNLKDLKNYKGTISNSIERYDLIKKLAKLNTNFNEVSSIYNQFNSFSQDLQLVNDLMQQQLEDTIYPDSEVPNLLLIHYKLTELWDFKDKLTKYAKNSNSDDQRTIMKFFSNLDKLVENFNFILKECVSVVTEAIAEGNLSLAIRLVKIIEYEEKEDLKLQIIQNLISKKADANEVLSKHCNRTAPRNYKDFYLDAAEANIKETFDNCIEAYADNKFEILDNLEWVYDDLAKIYQCEANIYPKRWKAFSIFYQWYYKYMNQIMNELINLEPESIIILDILRFDTDHQKKVKQLFHLSKDENKSIIGEDSKEELLKDYLHLITSKTDSWMQAVLDAESKLFLSRTIPPDTDGNGLFYLQDSKTVFAMFSQEAEFAAGSGEAKILLGVIDHFEKLLTQRSEFWQKLIRDELAKYHRSLQQSGVELNGGFIEYLIAVGNDQINGCDIIESLSGKFTKLVHSKFKEQIKSKMNTIIEKSIDVSEVVKNTLLELMQTDIEPIFSKIFTKVWYSTGDDLIKQLTSTLQEYFEEFRVELHKEIYDPVVEECFSIVVVLQYLQQLKKYPKFNMKKITDCLRRDLEKLYEFFSQFISSDLIVSTFRIFEIIFEILDDLKDERVIIEKFSQIYLRDFWDFNIKLLGDILKNGGLTDKKVMLITNECDLEQQKYRELVEDDSIPTFMSRY